MPLASSVWAASVSLDAASAVGVQNSRLGSRFNLDLQLAGHGTSYSCGVQDAPSRERAGAYSGVDGFTKDAFAGLTVAYRSDGGAVHGLPGAQGPFNEAESPSTELGLTYQIIRGVADGVEFQLLVRSPFAPSTTPDSPQAKLSSAPLFPLQITAINRTNAPVDGSLLLSLGHARPGIQPFAAGTVLHFQAPDEKGERVLYTGAVPGLTVGTGPVAARFAAAGKVDASAGDPAPSPALITEPVPSPKAPGTPHLPPVIPGLPGLNLSPVMPTAGPPAVPTARPVEPANEGGYSWPVSLPPGGRFDAELVYAAYSNAPVMYDRRGAERPLYYAYTADFASAADVIAYWLAQRQQILAASDAFEQQLTQSSLTPQARYLVAATVHSYLGSTFLLRPAAGPGPSGNLVFATWEGDCRYISTLDVAHETGVFEGLVMPWALRMQLESWAATVRQDQYGAILPHDLGYDDLLTGVQAYSLLGGEMPVEENANFLLLSAWYLHRTGDSTYLETYRPLLLSLADSLLARDSDGDGVADRAAYYTTVDLPAAVHVAAQSSYFAVKEAAALLALADVLGTDGTRYRQSADTIVLTLSRTANSSPGGVLPTLLPGDWPAIIAANGYTAATVGDLSLMGSQPNDVLGDGLLYLVLMDHKSTEFDRLLALVSASRWAAAPSLGLTAGSPRLQPGVDEVWYSKLINGQIVDQFVAATRPALPWIGLDAASLAGERHQRFGIWGYVDSWTPSRGTPHNLGHYPRGVVSFALLRLPWGTAPGGSTLGAPAPPTGILPFAGR